MDSDSRFRTLGEPVCIFDRHNAFLKIINPTTLYIYLYLNAREYWFLKLGMVTNVGEGKLTISTVVALERLFLLQAKI